MTCLKKCLADGGCAEGCECKECHPVGCSTCKGVGFTLVKPSREGIIGSRCVPCPSCRILPEKCFTCGSSLIYVKDSVFAENLPSAFCSTAWFHKTQQEKDCVHCEGTGKLEVRKPDPGHGWGDTSELKDCECVKEFGHPACTDHEPKCMNQDNQVGWVDELKSYSENERDHSWNCAAHQEGLECCLEKDWLNAFISRVAKDSYAEGIRRAREVGNGGEKNCPHLFEPCSCAMEAIAKLEEEVKK